MSTNWVQIVVYPRTDFPQSVPDHTVYGLWEVQYFTGTSCLQTVSSYRSPERKTDKTYIRQDQPVFSWLSAIPQWETQFGVAPHNLQSQSFRVPERKSDKTYIRQNVPEFSWIDGALGLLETWQKYPAIEQLNWDKHYTAPERSVRGKKYRDIYGLLTTYPSQDWITEGKPAEAPAFDPQYFPPMQAQREVFRSRNRVADPIQSQPSEDNAWIQKAQPEFDAQLFPAIQFLSDSFRTRKRRKFSRTVGHRYIPEVTVAQDSQFLSFRTPEGRKDKFFIFQDQPAFTWLYGNIIWETWYQSASNSQTLSFRSGDKPSHGTYYTLTDQQITDWIYPNLPAIVFDPGFMAAVNQAQTQSFRAGTEQRKIDVRDTAPQNGWIENSIPWLIEYYPAVYNQQNFTFRSKDIRYNIDVFTDFPQFDWLRPTFPYLASYFPAIQSLYEHSYLVDRPKSFNDGLFLNRLIAFGNVYTSVLHVNPEIGQTEWIDEVSPSTIWVDEVPEPAYYGSGEAGFAEAGFGEAAGPGHTQWFDESTPSTDWMDEK